MADVDIASEVTDWKARGIALVVVIVGTLAAGASTAINSAWMQNTALAIATTLVSTGALSLLFEVALRRNVYREMIRLVGINRSVSSAQIVSAGSASELNWRDVFHARSNVLLLLTDPLPWIDVNIVSLIENSKQRPIEVKFLFVDPAASYAPEIANSLGIDKDAYTHSINQSIDRIERTWKDLKARGKLALKSKIEVRLLDVRPLYSLASCDDVTIVLITSVTGRIGADTDYYYRHEGNRGVYPASWHIEQLARLTMLPIRFSDEVQ